jgi:hypothetical protein
MASIPTHAARFEPRYKAKLYKRIIALVKTKRYWNYQIADILTKEGFRTTLGYTCDETFVKNCRARIRELERLGRLKEVLRAK